MSRSINILKLFTVTIVCFLFPLFIASVNPQLGLGATAIAEEEKKEPKYKNVKTRQSQSVGAKCGKALEKVQVVLEEENYVESLKILEDIEASSKTCKRPYEQTQVWRYKGIVYLSSDNYTSAISSFKQVINGEGTPEKLRVDTRYTLAQLLASEERYAEAARELETWMAESTIVGNDARGLLAQLYYRLERKDESLRMVELAIDDVESKGITPKERWWTLQRVLYYEKNDYNRVISILEKLVKYYPKWTYWKQLGGMYGQQERDMDSLVASELLYLNNQLDKESQVKSMALMYLAKQVPYRGAMILHKGIKDEIVEPTAKNLETLGMAWYQAKELNRALKSFELASKKSDSGNLQSRIASINLDLGRDIKAYQASKRAVKKGSLKYPDDNYLVMGMALINLHCYEDAISAFRKSVIAAKTKKDKRSPNQFIKYADYERIRLGKLRDLGAKVPSCAK